MRHMRNIDKLFQWAILDQPVPSQPGSWSITYELDQLRKTIQLSPVQIAELHNCKLSFRVVCTTAKANWYRKQVEVLKTEGKTKF